MRIGIITSSGSGDWPLDGEPARRVVTTRYLAARDLPALGERPPAVGFVYRLGS